MPPVYCSFKDGLPGPPPLPPWISICVEKACLELNFLGTNKQALVGGYLQGTASSVLIRADWPPLTLLCEVSFGVQGRPGLWLVRSAEINGAPHSPSAETCSPVVCALLPSNSLRLGRPLAVKIK